MKIKYAICSALVLLTISGCSSNTNKESKSTNDKSEVSVKKNKKDTSKDSAKQSNSETKAIDISGTFYTTSGDTATINRISDNKWQMTYPTAEGNVTATFTTNWKSIGSADQSTTAMKKSDGSTGFDIIVSYVSSSNTKIKMTDGTAAHEMVFTRQKPQVDSTYDVVLTGDLTPFAGQFSTDEINQKIADEGFVFNGYGPEDFFSDNTTVFEAIRPDGFWSGSTHAVYMVKSSDLPKKVSGYYEVNVYAANMIANGDERTFCLVPPNAKGPDGTVNSEKRVFEKNEDGTLRLLEYQKENWWKDYQ